MENPYTIESFFLHQKLSIQILDPINKTILEKKLKDADFYDNNLKEIFINQAFTDSIVKYLTQNKVDSLEERLVKGEGIKKGELVWFENNFYFKGIGKAMEANKSSIFPAYAEFHIHLKRYKFSVKGKYNYEHIFGNSALDRLSGHKNKFILAVVDEMLDNGVILRPIIIGDRILTNELNWLVNSSSLKINIEDVDEFSKVSSISFSNKLDLNKNKSIPERNIKSWFAEILNESNVTKDWGGETSDLFTNHIHINQKRYNAAFLLKGPSKFHEMSVKDLGANGDQIVRLFNEPADILFLQHCHYVKQDVYKTMEAFASRFYNIKRYCIIDGIDTLRILKAYNKI